jgi:citrate synthase
MIPGYNHSVLRHTDPRFLHLLNFASGKFKSDPLIYLVNKLYKLMPNILKTVKNTKNPWPNVDAISGAVLNHYGIKEMEYYIIVMLVSRSIGSCSNLILQRYLGKSYCK